MIILKRTFLLLMITGFISVSTNIQEANAQRRYRRASEYQKLAFISQYPPVFFSTFTLPGKSKGQLLFTVIFNINYQQLTFLKTNGNSGQGDFFSPTAFNLDLFHAKKELEHSNKRLFRKFHPRKRSEKDQIDVSELSSIAHTAWQDTAYASSYSQTTLPDKSLSGSMQVQVQPGTYIYFIQPARSEGAHGFKHRVKVSSYSQTPVNNVIFVKSINGNNPSRLQLMNMGHNVFFGKDYYAFIHLPNYKEGARYQLKIEKVQIKKNGPQPIKTVYKQMLSNEEIIKRITPVLHSNAHEVSLALNETANGYTYALVQVPNHNFENATYKLTLTNETTSSLAAVDYYQSYWKNMPASLLSLNVAINMMKYIASEQTIDHINSGSFQQRKKGFENFWEAKDPTPKTPYNELEAEYYARIDSAYQKFTTQNTLGYESSRGKVYILYGAPQHKKRTYPTNGPTRIAWVYPSRKFVFKAVSSLGDFKLIKTIKK